MARLIICDRCDSSIPNEVPWCAYKVSARNEGGGNRDMTLDLCPACESKLTRFIERQEKEVK